jgi:hypothetical protein
MTLTQRRKDAEVKIMNTLQEIKLAIMRLDNDSRGQLFSWFENYLAEKWENRFAVDVKAGRLERLGADADHAFKRGDCKLL